MIPSASGVGAAEGVVVGEWVGEAEGAEWSRFGVSAAAGGGGGREQDE